MTDEAREAMKKKAFEEWVGYWAIECTNKARFGLLHDHLATQFSINTDQYPKTINGALDILTNHKYESNLQTKESTTNAENKEQVLNTSFAQFQTGKQYQCYCCGKMGHASSICTKASTTKHEHWWIIQ